MIYPYAVKHDGVWYSAGQDIPDQRETVNANVPEDATTTPVRKRGRPSKRKGDNE